MFSDIIRRAAHQFTGNTAVMFGDTSMNYSVLYERSCRLANALRDAGVLPGESVASLGLNRLESMEELTAVALGGFVRSPLYMQDMPARQAFMLRRVGSTALIIDAAAWERLKPEIIGQDGPKLKLILVRDVHASSGPLERAYETALAAASTADPKVERDIDLPYVLRFSAGTTGMPKPIVHSERAYHTANQEVLLNTQPLDPSDVYLAVSPYSHASGNMIWPFISAGASHVVMQGFDAEKALALIEKYRCTTLFLVPTMIQRLLSAPGRASTDLSSIRRILYGAAPIPQDLIQVALDTFGDVLCQVYGQSEIVPLTTLTPRDHRDAANGNKNRLRSAGRPTPNSFVRIEAENGTPCAIGEIGEVVGKSPGVMLGIFGDPAATAQRFTEDGWLRTNDLGWLDKDGYLFIADRKDDMIISGGFNIAPSEIEDALSSHVDVVEAVVFGIPNPVWGSSPMAVVRLADGAETSVKVLMEWCQQKVGSMKRPAVIILTDEPLPISSAGKLLRTVAREKFSKQAAENVAQ